MTTSGGADVPRETTKLTCCLVSAGARSPRFGDAGSASGINFLRKTVERTPEQFKALPVPAAHPRSLPVPASTSAQFSSPSNYFIPLSA